MGKRFRISFTIAMLVLVLGVGSAMATVTADSTTWEHYYECDQTPADEGFAMLGDQADIDYTVVTAGGDTYINAFTYDDYRGWSMTAGNDAGSDSNDLDTSTNGGCSIEWRMRCLDGDFFFHFWTSGDPLGRWLTTYVETPGHTYPWNKWLFNPNRTFPTQPSELYFRDSDLTKSNWRDPLPSADSWVMGNLEAGDDTFYTYRITGNGTNWRQYRWDEDNPGVLNGMLMVDTTTRRNEVPSPTYQIKVYAERSLTEYDLDYIRFTDQGAFPPFAVTCAEQGAWVGYAKEDLNEDCTVDVADFAQFASAWLTCEDTTNADCDR